MKTLKSNGWIKLKWMKIAIKIQKKKRSRQEQIANPDLVENRSCRRPDLGPAALIHSIVSNNQELKESFYVLDLARVASLNDHWTRSLLTIRPKAFFELKRRNSVPKTTLSALREIKNSRTSAPKTMNPISLLKRKFHPKREVTGDGGVYEPDVEDLITLTKVWPKCIDDLNWPK
ncbi:ornithine decarboxylase [Sarracenia purpurea var. burkii]